MNKRPKVSHIQLPKIQNNYSEIFHPLSEKGKQLSEQWSTKDFSFVNQLEEGSTCKVWLAIEDKSDKKCAIKVIDKGQPEMDNFLLYHLTRREIDIQSTLKSKYIIKMYGWFETDYKYYLVFQLGDRDLFNCVYRKEKSVPLSIPKALRYIKMIAIALMECHKLNVIHRDVKLENMIMDKGSDTVYLTDFGLSDYDTGNLNIKCGSSYYSSPEVLNSLIYNYKTDIWSLGVAFYVMIIGTYPFDPKRNNFNLIFTQSVPLDIQDCIRRMLNINPVERIELKDLLELDVFRNVNLD